MATPTLLQTLTLTVDSTSYEAQLSNAAVVPSYSDTTVETFAGSFPTTSESHALHLEGFQDYGAVDGLCDLLWTTDLEATIAFVLTTGGATWTGTVSPRKPNAGGSAGGALDFTIDLPCQGTPLYAAPAAP